MTAPTCCHDNFEWHDPDTLVCPACGLDHHVWQCIATTRTNTLINHLTGDTMTLPVQILDGGRTPTRAHQHDAGIDLYSTVNRMIDWGTITTIPLGVRVAIPEGHVGLLTIRSSLGREGLVIPNAPGVVDSGYRGELMMQVTMVKDDGYAIRRGDRIGQLVILPIVTPAVEIVDQLPPSADGRGAGGFGSSGR